MSAHVLATLGLLFDIVGAIWIVKSVVAGKDDELAEASDSSATWAGGPAPRPRPALLKVAPRRAAGRPHRRDPPGLRLRGPARGAMDVETRHQSGRDEQIQPRGRELIALVAPHVPKEFDVGPAASLWEPIGTGPLTSMTTTLGFVLDLQRSRLEADASTLVRSLYEHAVHFAWLAGDPLPASIERRQKHDLKQRLKADDDTEVICRGRVPVELEAPSGRNGPYGMATLVYGVVLLAAAKSLGWPSAAEVLGIFERTA